MADSNSLLPICLVRTLSIAAVKGRLSWCLRSVNNLTVTLNGGGGEEGSGYGRFKRYCSECGGKVAVYIGQRVEERYSISEGNEVSGRRVERIRSRNLG